MKNLIFFNKYNQIAQAIIQLYGSGWINLIFIIIDEYTLMISNHHAVLIILKDTHQVFTILVNNSRFHVFVSWKFYLQITHCDN